MRYRQPHEHGLRNRSQIRSAKHPIPHILDLLGEHTRGVGRILSWATLIGAIQVREHSMHTNEKIQINNIVPHTYNKNRKKAYSTHSEHSTSHAKACINVTDGLKPEISA